MAHKKAGGSTRNGRDSNPKYLGVKRYGGETVQPGTIILRQRGTATHPGEGAYLGKDHTIHAAIAGRVFFAVKGLRKRKVVCVLPQAEG